MFSTRKHCRSDEQKERYAEYARKRHRKLNLLLEEDDASKKLEKEIESLKGAVNSLKEDLSALLCILQENEAERRTWELEKDIFEQEVEDLKTKSMQFATIVDNCKNLLNELPQNNDFRQPLTSVFIRNLNEKQAFDLLGVNRQTFYRARKRCDDFLKMKLKKKKKRMDPKQVELAMTILNSIAPVKSGRDYRLLTCTYDILYERYLDLAKQEYSSLTPLSKSYLINSILAKERIHVLESLISAPVVFNIWS